MELQEKIAVNYLFEATHKEHVPYIRWDYFIRRRIVIHFNWQLIDISEYKIVFNQN